MRLPTGPRLKLPAVKLPGLKPGGAKAPQLKVPPFLVDLWWDLWDRRLLPLVVLVVAAIAAVPFVIGGGSKQEPPPAAGALAGGTAGGGTPELTVVEAKPGLRDYHRRLGRRIPTDPFKQRYAATSASLPGAQLGGGGASFKTTTKAPSPSSKTSGAGESGGGESKSASGGESKATSPEPSKPSSKQGETAKGDEAKQGASLYTYSIAVKITRSGGRNAAPGQKPQSWTKKDVSPLTELPGEKAPVVTYMGTSEKGKPLLLVSTDVHSVFGEGKCVSGSGACQLLEVDPGFPEIFVYGTNEVHYTINVLKVDKSS